MATPSPRAARRRRADAAVAGAEVARHHPRHGAPRARLLVAARRPRRPRRRRRSDDGGRRRGHRVRPVAAPVRVHRARRSPPSTQRAPGGRLRAMGLCLLVGIPVSALAADAVTGIVAGVGAGGIVALRADEPRRVAAAGRRRGGGHRLHLRAGPGGGSGRADRRAHLPVHRPRPRRPLGGVASRPGSPTAVGARPRPATGERRRGGVPRRLPLGRRDLGVPDRGRRRPGRSGPVDLGHVLRHARAACTGGDDARVAADHRNRMREDVALLASLGDPCLPLLGGLATGHAVRRRPGRARPASTSTARSSTSSSPTT